MFPRGERALEPIAEIRSLGDLSVNREFMMAVQGHGGSRHVPVIEPVAKVRREIPTFARVFLRQNFTEKSAPRFCREI